MTQINNEHLKFLEEAKQAFINDPILETYRNEDDEYIALRVGLGRDCLLVFELGEEVANFVQQIPMVRLEIKIESLEEQ